MVETVTSHYGWTKPEITKSASTWGGFLNTDLDSIDAQLWSINAQVNANYISISRGPDGGTYGQILFQNNGNTQARWRLGETSEAEGSGNTGTNFVLDAFDNSGAYLGNVFEAIRGTQNVTFAKAVTIGGTLNVSGAATYAGSVACNSLMSTHAISCDTLSVGTSASLPIVTSPTVNTTTVNATTVNATTVNATGAVSGTNLTATNGFVNVVRGSTANATLFLNDNARNTSAFFYDQATLQTIVGDLISGAQLTLDSAGNFHFNGTANAYKAGGGSWSSPSDARIKTVVGDYGSGLDQVLQLRPITYTYKGNDGAPGENSPMKHVEGKQFVGFVAQEAEGVMPEMVSRHEGYVDGQKVVDLRSVDTSALIFALVNSVKELKAEIEALKAR